MSPAIQTPAALSELPDGSTNVWNPDMIWIYAFGERGGGTIKWGFTKEPTLRKRLDTVNRDQMTSDRYVPLVAVRGWPKDEAHILRYFEEFRIEKGSRTEYFEASPEIVEYVAWLRRGWWSTISLDSEEELAVDSSHWLPTPDRRVAPPPMDASVLVQEWDTRTGPLSGTAWSWMPDPRASFQDYFTPPELVASARSAMGDIDLDAASHWAANKTHRIPDYFDVNRSAFDHDWHGRVWLNPPYGDNGPWFDRLLHFVDAGAVTQLCMLSPVWAFNTDLAREVMSRVSGMILLSPTPRFWGNADGKTGTNQPHAIIYIGHRAEEFFTAFAPHGIPFSIPTRLAAAQ